MNRKDFGELVAALRQDLGWTQFQLAEYADLDAAVISQIERGVKRFFEPELLFCLANAFQLTTLERREFIFAASGLDEKQIVRQPSGAMATDVFDAKKILGRMTPRAGRLRLLRFYAMYSDDRCEFHDDRLYNVRPPCWKRSKSARRVQHNALNFGRPGCAYTGLGGGIITPKLDARTRENSLRYRARPYFKYLMKHFEPASFLF
jgi:transcriptional regulator with XRE-family HTH domain